MCTASLPYHFSHLPTSLDEAGVRCKTGEPNLLFAALQTMSNNGPSRRTKSGLSKKALSQSKRKCALSHAVPTIQRKQLGGTFKHTHTHTDTLPVDAVGYASHGLTRPHVVESWTAPFHHRHPRAGFINIRPNHFAGRLHFL